MALVKPKGNSDSLTATERAVCAAWDNGQSIERIARSLRLHRDRVSDIVSGFNDSGETRRTLAAMRHGSAQLLAALQANQQAAA